MTDSGSSGCYSNWQEECVSYTRRFLEILANLSYRGKQMGTFHVQDSSGPAVRNYSGQM
jgi:hypothetical protein